MTHAGRGSAWEHLIEMWGRRYERSGRAVLLRTPPPVRLLKAQPGGRWLAAITSEGPPDYTMLIGRSSGAPLAVLAEAKDCQASRWSFKQLHHHQASKLDQWHAIGGFACVLVGHQKTSTGYVLPWKNLAPVWRRWHAGQLIGRRASPGTASLDAGGLSALGHAWSFGDGFIQAMLESAES